MRSSRPFFALGLLLATSLARGESAGSAALSIRQARYRLAVVQASRGLEENPDEPDLHATLATAWSKAGYFADAAGAFELCAGSAYYESHGLDAHADQIRAMGQGREAATLRLQQLVNPQLADARRMRVLLAAADDLLVEDAPREALELAERAMAAYPRSPMVHAVLADIHLAMGDEEEADFHAWLSASYGQTTRLMLVEARRELAAGNTKGAYSATELAREQHSGSLKIPALRAEIRRVQGDLDSAMAILSLKKWIMTEDPVILAVRIKVFTDAGDWGAAEELADRAQGVYPDNQDIHEALAYWKARVP